MGKKRVIHTSTLTKDIHKIFDILFRRHSKWQIFSDFIAIAACAISNSVDIRNYKEREKQYMDTVKKYSSEELNLFTQILAELVKIMEKCAQNRKLQDVLGQLFHEFGLHNERRGQFFTPQIVSDMMALMMLGDSIQEIKKCGFASFKTLGEPACGSGVMMISAANAMQKAGYNYCTQMVADCTDIDISCVHMCYIQLSLYGVPAVVRHGNSLMFDVWSNWYTPVFVIDRWFWKYGR